LALTDNLVAYYSLDEASGAAIDAHSTHDLAETSGTIGSATGKVGGARDFEAGDSEWFEIADNTDLSMGDIDMSGQVWVNLESKASRQCFVVKGSGVSGEYYVEYNNGSDRFEFTVAGGSGFTSLTNVRANNFGSPSTGVWYCLHFWHDSVANEIGISVNAGTPDTASHSAGILDANTPFQIGSYSGFSLHTDGLLDEVGIWKRVLTSQDRTDLYNSGNGLAYPLTVGGGATGNRRRRMLICGVAA
jgi:hypothetical protein